MDAELARSEYAGYTACKAWVYIIIEVFLVLVFVYYSLLIFLRRRVYLLFGVQHLDRRTVENV